MNVDFRCEHCGKLLSAPAHANEPIRCPHCQKLTAVPAGLAALPHPKMEGAAPSPPPLPPGAAPQAAEEAPPGEFVGVMERLMPFVISLFFHLSLVLVFLFVTSQMMAPKAPPGEIVVPSMGVAMPGEDDDTGGGTLTPTERPTGADSGGSRFNRITESSVRSSIIASPGGSGGARPGMAMIGVGGATGGNSTGTGTGSGKWFGGGGGGGGFFGLGGGRGGGRGGLAKYVVYVIDRSGSMLSTFDAVRYEMLTSIGQLDPKQSFHVIFFSEGVPQEPVEKRLVPANTEFKAKASEGLHGVFAKGQTDPVPAVTRAFDVLDKADVGGKVLYLLTDAAFPDNQKVIDLCKTRNAKKDVHIYTFLYGDRPKEAEETMKKIAAENGGKYKFVSAEE